MEKIVIRIGGHLIFSSDEINVVKLKEISDVLKKAYNEGKKVIVVVGGGDYARRYINAAGLLRASEFEKDYLAILITRVNAFLVILALGEIAHQHIPTNINEILSISSSTQKIIVCGGLIPGQSTMSVAALLAEAIKADMLINVTNVEGVYTFDPKRRPDAKFLKRVSTTELKEILSKQGINAGEYELIEQQAINIVERSKIPLRIINGNNVENIIDAIYGKDVGTLVIPS
ncbi:MAG: UMP kinase [Nitrososphaeria archaeon]